MSQRGEVCFVVPSRGPWWTPNLSCMMAEIAGDWDWHIFVLTEAQSLSLRLSLLYWSCLVLLED